MAIGSLVCSLGALLLLFSLAGLLFPVTLVLSIVGVVLGRKGMGKVDRGETAQYRSLAKAGFVLGIIGIVLALIAAAVLIALFIADPNWLEDLDTDTTEDGYYSTLIAILARP
ncbi:MAG: hypothetical protein H0T15_07375 [Thermoleophilaceae bacterium]|nr:hypothetical protein [Thermoleophilaceae bacterium]